MNKDQLSQIELLSIIFIGVIGLSMIFFASGSTYIAPESYDLDIDMYMKEGEPKRLNYFLFTYDFSKQNGNLSFKINDNQNVDYIMIDFFSFINANTTTIRIFDEDCPFKQQELEGMKFELNFIDIPSNKPEYTTFVIENENNLNLSDKCILIEFESDIRPSGIFTIHHNKFPLSDFQYAFEYILGNKYECQDGCINKNFNLNIEEFRLSSRENIKLKFPEEDYDFHRFKIEGSKKLNVVFVILFSGLGISLLGSAMILLFQYWIASKRDKIKVNCPFCTKIFKNKDGLKRHIRRIH